MEYPKEIVKKDRKGKVSRGLSHIKNYKFIKEYPNFVLYENKMCKNCSKYPFCPYIVKSTYYCNKWEKMDLEERNFRKDENK